MIRASPCGHAFAMHGNYIWRTSVCQKRIALLLGCFKQWGSYLQAREVSRFRVLIFQHPKDVTWQIIFEYHLVAPPL